MSNIINKIITDDPDVRKFVETFSTLHIKNIEQSTKIDIGKRYVHKNRVCVIIDKSDITKETFIDYATNMKIPESCAQDMYDMYDSCSAVGFGLDKDFKGTVNLRLYAEKTYSKEEIEAAKEEGTKELESIVGVKWKLDRPEHYDKSLYMLQLYNETQEDRNSLIERTGFHFVPEILLKDKTPISSVNYFATNKGAYDRNAFYIRVSESDSSFQTKVKDLTQDVYNFTKTDLAKELAPFADVPISMIAGGVDKVTTNRYLTIYFMHYNVPPSTA